MHEKYSINLLPHISTHLPSHDASSRTLTYSSTHPSTLVPSNQRYSDSWDSSTVAMSHTLIASRFCSVSNCTLMTGRDWKALIGEGGGGVHKLEQRSGSHSHCTTAFPQHHPHLQSISHSQDHSHFYTIANSGCRCWSFGGVEWRPGRGVVVVGGGGARGRGPRCYLHVRSARQTQSPVLANYDDPHAPVIRARPFTDACQSHWMRGRCISSTGKRLTNRLNVLSDRARVRIYTVLETD